jgi:hypothetical protein
MSANCIHGLPRQACALCLSRYCREPLPTRWQYRTTSGKRCVLLRDPRDSDTVRILLTDEPQLIAVSRGAITPTDDAPLEWFDLIKRRVQDLGALFVPTFPLTYRERISQGPPHCRQCRAILSFEYRSLGCRHCEGYVCACGTCMCGFSGTNWLGQFFHGPAGIAVPREDRVDCIRVLRHLSSAPPNP